MPRNHLWYSEWSGRRGPSALPAEASPVQPWVLCRARPALTWEVPVLRGHVPVATFITPFWPPRVRWGRTDGQMVPLNSPRMSKGAGVEPSEGAQLLPSPAVLRQCSLRSHQEHRDGRAESYPSDAGSAAAVVVRQSLLLSPGEGSGSPGNCRTERPEGRGGLGGITAVQDCWGAAGLWNGSCVFVVNPGSGNCWDNCWFQKARRDKCLQSLLCAPAASSGQSHSFLLCFHVNEALVWEKSAPAASVPWALLPCLLPCLPLLCNPVLVTPSKPGWLLQTYKHLV